VDDTFDSESADAEGSYRRGYYQGAWDVIDAVTPLLLPADAKKLHDWHTKKVHRWRYLDKSRRGPDDAIIRAIIPPRQNLKLSGSK